MADPRDWREDADYSGPGHLYIAAARLAGMAGAVLGWRPREFWNATPAELAAILNAMAGETAVVAASAADLARLKEMYPDG